MCISHDTNIQLLEMKPWEILAHTHKETSYRCSCGLVCLSKPGNNRSVNYSMLTIKHRKLMVNKYYRNLRHSNTDIEKTYFSDTDSGSSCG